MEEADTVTIATIDYCSWTPAELPPQATSQSFDIYNI